MVEDERQMMRYVLDYLKGRWFFSELSEMITGKDRAGAACTKKIGDDAKQMIDFEEIAVGGNTLELDENFYGDQDFDLEDFDQDGFDMDHDGSATSDFSEDRL